MLNSNLSTPQSEISVMNKIMLALLGGSYVLSSLVLISHAAVAEDLPSVPKTTNTPQYQHNTQSNPQVAGTVALPTNSRTTQTTQTHTLQVNPRVFSLDPSSETVGNLASAQLGCDCPGCRASALQMLQSGKLTLPQ
ncbi:hypothetical protein [Brasilonema sennae]